MKPLDLRCWLVATVCALACVTPSYSQSADSETLCDTLPEPLITKVYFSNGAGGTDRGARNSLLALQEAYEKPLMALRDDTELFAGETYEFEVSFNPSQGSDVDITQVFLQKLSRRFDGGNGRLSFRQRIALGLAVANDNSAEIEDIRRIISLDPSFGDGDEADAARAAELASIEQQIADGQAIRDAYWEALIETAARERDFVTAAHASTYRSDLDKQHRVIVVAHSQGNLFANESLTLARESSADADSSAIIAVGTPANRVLETLGRQGFYANSSVDRVNRLLRGAGFDVLEDNVDNVDGADPNDERNHFFLNSYFAEDAPSRTLIDMEMFDLARTLEYPKDEKEIALRLSVAFNVPEDYGVATVFEAREPQGNIIYLDGRNFTPNGASGTVGPWFSDGPDGAAVFAEPGSVGEVQGEGRASPVYSLGCDSVGPGDWSFEYFTSLTSQTKFVEEKDGYLVDLDELPDALTAEVRLETDDGENTAMTTASMPLTQKPFGEFAKTGSLKFLSPMPYSLNYERQMVTVSIEEDPDTGALTVAISPDALQLTPAEEP